MSKSAKLIYKLTPIALAIALSACGGGGSDFGVGSGSSDDTANTGDTTGTVDEVEVLEYTLGQMNVGLTNLSAGGSTGITLEIRDQNGDLSAEEQTVTFTSDCISNGTSTVTSPVVSRTGVFTTTYTALGCEGDDVVTANFIGQDVKSTITVEPANLGAVEFISADPQTILLQGMSAPGLQHTSTVKFQIKNDVGGPLANEDVTFSLTSDVGGIRLSSTEGKTDNEGYVSTILQAGTVHANVRVRATVDRNGTSISSESSQLVISTGVADQNSLSISLSEHNPSAWNHDGEKVNVNIYASDRYNNPVPDGTTVSFYTELGQIEPSCQTSSGACVVEWTSSEPRDLGITDPLYPRDTYDISDGITTITATIIGEESFIDTNSNGIFDDGDQLDTFSDRGEAFEDYNKNYDTDTPRDDIANNKYDAGLEPYLDFNSNGVRDPKDNKYTGLGCQHPTLCAADNSLKDIFTSIELVLAEDNQSIRIWQGAIGTGALLTGSDPIRNGVNYTIEVSGQRNNQVPPVGTTINASSDVADIVVGSNTVASTNFHLKDLTSPSGNYGVQLYVKDSDPAEYEAGGFIEIKVVTPKGINHSLLLPYQDDDNGAPFITLNGDNPVNHEVGTNYTDPGATAIDSVDGDLSGDLVIAGDTIDNSTAVGTYEITYDVSDSTGNNATQIIRTINVVDTTAPVIVLNGNNPETHEAGTIYTDSNASASDNVDGDLSSSVIIAGDIIDDSTGVGTYTTTYDVSDASGNTATQVTRTVNVVDTTVPTITDSFANPLHTQGTAYTDVLTGITSSDNVDGDISGDITVGGDIIDDTTVAGTYTITYDVNDAAGNSATQITRTVIVQ